MAEQQIRVVKKCPVCDWRILDKVTPTSGIIEIKCPKCRKIVPIDLSNRIAQPSRRIYYRIACRV